MHKCRVAICDYKILSPEGFTHFLCTTWSYIGLGPVQKKTGPDQSQDHAGPIKTGPKWSSPGPSQIRVKDWTRPDFKTLPTTSSMTS